jgi:hypothetical protein
MYPKIVDKIYFDNTHVTSKSVIYLYTFTIAPSKFTSADYGRN